MLRFTVLTDTEEQLIKNAALKYFMKSDSMRDRIHAKMTSAFKIKQLVKRVR